MKVLLQTVKKRFRLLVGTCRSERGFSMVEVLVSGVFVALSVVAVVTAVTTGVKLQVNDNDRRQARALIKSVFEEQYDFRNFNSIVSNTTRTETVVIDERGSAQLQGEMTIAVQDVTPATGNGTTFPAKQVTITCRWNTDPGILDSIRLTKIVAQAQR